MYYVKLKDIYFNDKIKNQNQIKRDLNHRYGMTIDNMIMTMCEDIGLMNASISISKGEPWFGNNGMLNVRVHIHLMNDDGYDLRFELQWNHTSFVTDKRVITDTDWW